MSRSVQRVEAALAAHGIVGRIVTLAATARTAEDAALACDVPVGAIVKSLLFEVADEPVLALVAGDRRCDAAGLAAAMGHAGEARRCDAAKVRAVTGFAIGGVAPLGHLQPRADRDRCEPRPLRAPVRGGRPSAPGIRYHLGGAGAAHRWHRLGPGRGCLTAARGSCPCRPPPRAFTCRRWIPLRYLPLWWCRPTLVRCGRVPVDAPGPELPGSCGVVPVAGWHWSADAPDPGSLSRLAKK